MTQCTKCGGYSFHAKLCPSCGSKMREVEYSLKREESFFHDHAKRRRV